MAEDEFPAGVTAEVDLEAEAEDEEPLVAVGSTDV